MKTVEDLIEMLSKYPRSTPVFETFEACGNNYYRAPIIKEGKLKDGTFVIVLFEDINDSYDPIPADERDIVDFNGPPF